MSTAAVVDLGAWIPLISVVTTAVGATAGYYGSKAAFMVQLARMEEKHSALEKRFDSDHAELERLQETVSRLGRGNAN